MDTTIGFWAGFRCIVVEYMWNTRYTYIDIHIHTFTQVPGLLEIISKHTSKQGMHEHITETLSNH